MRRSPRAPTWRTETWDDIGAGLVALFDAHWRDRPDEGWKVLSLHDAVRDELIKWAKGDSPPIGPDPEEHRTRCPAAGLSGRARSSAGRACRGSPSRWRLVRGAGDRRGRAAALTRPRSSARQWRHGRVGTSWPTRSGLGKTIEAGFIIRELLLSGKAERFLAPRSCRRAPPVAGGAEREAQPAGQSVRGWRVLSTPTTRSCRRLAPHGRRSRSCSPRHIWPGGATGSAKSLLRVHGTSCWSTRPITPDVGRQAERHAQPAAADCSRHAGQQRSYKALFLASATPMQMHPHEAWDLVELLGLPGHWARVLEGVHPLLR